MRIRSSSVDVIGIVAIVAVLALVTYKLQRPSGPAPVKPGTAMPAMAVEGWLNLPDGESFDPAGKIVVVDLWATWCPPCRAEIPRLAKVVEQYRPLGVEFVGLTSETERDAAQIQKFLDDTPEFDWPVGYGAIDFWNALDVHGIPTVIVFGPDGKVRWSVAGAGQSGLEEALDQVLAEDGGNGAGSAESDES